jgi:alkylation response protein AidB-like acyl-CoA dehydrogenase
MNSDAMTFDDSPSEAEFRASARAWIHANAPTELYEALKHSGYGTLDLGSIDVISACKAWQSKKSAAGWAALQWPRAYGGRGATAMERVIWEQEEGVYGKLAELFLIGFGMCGPTIIAHGTEEQRQRLLPPLISGAEVWCQLFSEPAAGSDLAGIRTRAQRVDNRWLLNGQKMWTSFAHAADFGIVLTRTNASVPKHKGLTMFWVDMHSPGIEVRPIKQASGRSDFNEVYFTDVQIMDHQRLGEEGGGWKVALTTLMNERLMIGATMPTGFEAFFDFCDQLPMRDGLAIDDPAVRAKLAGWAVRAKGLQFTSMRSLSALAKGDTPGPENSIGKLVAGSMMQDMAIYALDLQGRAGVLDDEGDGTARRFQAMLMRSIGTRIEGGTDEILRNIIAERVLGLPPDIRVDKDLPFDSLSVIGARDSTQF